jgi:hypothetical protein
MGTRVAIPVAAPLKALLDTEKRRSTLILTQRDGKPWTKEGFSGVLGREFVTTREGDQWNATDILAANAP